jgi:hypothetical protein
VTQASLSPDLHGPLGATPSVRNAAPRHGSTSEASLWMIALTSAGLLLAALLLLGLLVRNAVSDASLGGFVSGAGIVIAVLGIGGISFAMVTARRAGYLDAIGSSLADRTTKTIGVVPAGMHVVPALPADLGRRKRRQLEEARAVRARQAKAIAAATTSRAPRPAAPRPPDRGAIPARTAPRPPRRRAAPTAVARHPSPASLRPAPAQPARPASRPAPVRRVAVALMKPPTPARPAITMPGPHARPVRPAAWPAQAAFPGMGTPPLRPRTQVAMLQVHAANVRTAAPVRYR